ncbi:MAG: MFS transporter [Aureliella sp.]
MPPRPDDEANPPETNAGDGSTGNSDAPDRGSMSKSEGSGKPSAKAESASGPWAPLAFPMYRSFWVAGLFSNLGTWMHETGAQWHMASMEPSPEMVSAVRTSMTIPVLLLALPAGVWADRFDRRKWLLGTQSLLLVIAVLMAALSFFGWMSPVMLLVLTAAMGIAMILNQPAWQALTPELVPAALVPTAVSVGSISFNLARAIGPAVAGLVIAQLGVGAAFAFNAVSFLGIICVLLMWKPEPEKKPRKPPQFSTELKKGLFLVKHTEPLKNALIRVALFALSASVLWSLISLVAAQKLNFSEKGFGISLGLIGAGAVIGASFLPTVRTKLSSETIVAAAQLIFAAVCAAIAMSDSPAVVLPGLFIIGGAWMTTMTTLNATAQVNLPRKFRARGMAAFLAFFAAGMAAGSLVWGWLGFATSLNVAFAVAAAILGITAIATFRLKIGSLTQS